MKRIGIVLSGNIEISPYYRYYTDVFDKINIEYDIISWDRSSLGTKSKYSYNYPSPESLNPLKKIIDFYKYSRYVKQVIKSSNYDYLIIFTIANAFFLFPLLLKMYKNRYTFDIRDYSPLLPWTQRWIEKIILNARQTCISSIGWIDWLPKNHNYIISHNLRYSDTFLRKQPDNISQKKPIIITTFGSLRDYDVNKKLMYFLKNSEYLRMEFIGAGYEPLLKFAKKKKINNVYFYGRYKKKDEPTIINRADIVNILLPRSTAHDGAMSNRFYKALINKKPVIVNEGNIQAEYVYKYHLGIIIKPGDNILKKINEYLNGFDKQSFNKDCDLMINKFKKDINIFESSLIQIFKEK